MAETGYAVEYHIDPQGSELDVAALATDLVLVVGDTSAYDPGMTVEVDGVTATVAATDDDASTLTLTAPLGIAADESERVLIRTAGEVANDYLLEVQTSDGESHDISLAPPDRVFWQPGPIDPPVLVTISDDLDHLLDIPGKPVVVNPDAIEAPLFVGYLAVNQTIPTGAGFSTVQNWATQILRGGMVYDPAFHSVVVPLAGWYSVNASAVAWAFNASGRRVTQPMYATLAGAVTGGQFKQDASPDPVQQTTPVISPMVALQAGESAALMVAQTSGGGLDLIGDSAGTSSFFFVEYRGPL